MEDSLEIIIYVIIAVASLVGNAYRNYNKRKQQEMQAGSLEDESYGQTEQSYHEPANEQEYAPGIPYEFKQAFEQVFETRSPEPEIAEEPDSIITEKVIDSQHKNEPEYTKEETDDAAKLTAIDDSHDTIEFELEKAVIFSEILKPKYIDTYY